MATPKKKPPTPTKKTTATKPVADKIVGVGHNGGPVAISKERLKAIVDRVESLEETIGGLRDDVKDVYAEAKAVGLNPKRIREIVALRRKDKEKLREEKEERELYMLALDPELADVLS
jgi:uncharacterized protein (UPF0335 family)